MCGTLCCSVFRESEKEQMSAQMFILSQTIAAEKEKTAKLELMARLCNYGESSVEDVCRKLFIIFT